MAIARTVRTRTRGALALLSNDVALQNATADARKRELGIARANIALARIRQAFPQDVLLRLSFALEHQQLCPWAINKLFDLLYAGLPATEARVGLHALLQAPDPQAREQVLKRLTGSITNPATEPHHIKTPSYLLHPAGAAR